MNRYYIRHIVEPEEIVHLSDRDSDIIIEKKTQKEKDFVEIQADLNIWLGQVVFIDKTTVEVEIVRLIKKVSDEDDDEIVKHEVILIQAVGNDRRVNMIMEKVTELGITKIIPILSELSATSLPDAKKNFTRWNQIIDEARIQSRNMNPPILEKPLLIEDLIEKIKGMKLVEFKKLCLTSEVMSKGEFSASVKHPGNYIFAVGPEKGWSASDIEIFKKLDFKFVLIGQNILRMETASLVAASIINYVNGKY